MRKIICFFMFFIIMLSTSGCGAKKEYIRYQKDFPLLFDTYISFYCYAESSEEFEKYSEITRESFEKYNELFDIYNDYDGINNIKTINDNAGKTAVSVDESIIELLEYGRQIYEDTDGAVNIAFGSVLSIWHNYREEGTTVPEISELEKAAEHIDIDCIQIDKDKGTVFISDENVSLDVGSCGKGYAVEKTAQALKEAGAKDFLINAGGNVCAVGKPVEKDAWTVGIENPIENSTDFVKTVSVTDKSVVTSGNYQRYYEVDGKRYHHIIDTTTLFPSEVCASATVIADNSAVADMLSTAIFVLPLEKSMELVKKYNAQAVWVMDDGEVFEV